MNTKSVVLIVSPPGDLQIGLQALLTAHLDVDVLVVSESSAALKVIVRHEPALAILDQAIPGNRAVELVRDIKTNWPGIICVILVNDDKGRQSFLGTGADLIVIKGLPGSKLIDEIDGLLHQRGENR